MRIFFALLAVLAGLVLLFGGYRLARFLIPLAGFIFGLSFGGALAADLGSAPFLGTLLGVVVGVVMGLLLAVLAYFYYYMAVIVLGAGLGYWAGSGFVLLLGFKPGLLSALVGIAIGALVGLFGIIANAPKYVLILLTSLAGAASAVGGVMLLFNKIPLDTFSYTTISVALSNSFFWSLTALALVVIGVIAQVMVTAGTYEFEAWNINDHHPLPPTTTPHAPGAH